MSYEKQTWVNRDLSKPLNDGRMNHIEDGIFQAAATADSAAATANAAQVAADLDADTATLVGDEGTATGAALSSAFVPLGSEAYVAKPSDNTDAGVLDWSNDASTGYLFHLRSGPSMGAAAAMIGIGTDEGHGGGILVSHKNDGIGIAVAVNPAASNFGLNVIGYSGSASLAVFDSYATSPGVLVQSKSGAAYKDGVANGTTTFTSATATFVVGDVGAAISQLTSTPTTPSVIPSGTTIAAYVNATTVTLSQAATGSATAIQFLVAGRLPSTGQAPFTIRPARSNQKALAIRKVTDAFDTVQIYENGGINFGAGTVATDVNLYRATNGRLGTDHQFQAVQGVATRVLSGAGKTTVADGDFTRTPPDGMVVFVLNTTDSTVKIAARISGAWKYSAALS
jgi:hypothetical protein